MRGACVSPGLDPRLNAYREDVADARLRGRVKAGRFIEGISARIVVGRAPVRRQTGRQSEIVTFYHYGESVLVFDEGGGFAWCQSLTDNYVCYVEAAMLIRGVHPEPTHFVATLGSYCYDEPDMQAPARDFLPRHAAVVVTGPKLATRDRTYVQINNGAFLPLPCLSRSPPRSPDIVAAAELYLNVPYLWGGRSFLGIDCSGLVQNAFRDVGVVVPRDTDMQRSAIGAEFQADASDELRRGDLIYISGHVLIGTGGDGAIHADGTNMMVRRQNVGEFLAERRLRLAEAVLRRPAPAAAARVISGDPGR